MEMLIFYIVLVHELSPLIKYVIHQTVLWLGTDHLIFRGGLGFFEKNSLFPNRGEKNKNVFNEVKNKNLVLHSVYFFEAFFPGSYKGWQNNTEFIV